MLDGVSLDQLRTFIAVADEKSFSAAGRRLRRAQSVVSQTMANLEGQLGVKLFERSAARLPVLTDQGRALLSDARAVAGDVDVLKARAKNLAGGLEPELSVAVDVMFPPAPLTAAVAAFQREFPSTLLNFEVESSAVVEPVFEGRCVLGLVSSWSRLPPNIACEPLLTVRRFSRHAIVFATAERVRRNRSAASAKLPASTTWTNTSIPLRGAFMLNWLQIGHRECQILLHWICR